MITTTVASATTAIPGRSDSPTTDATELVRDPDFRSSLRHDPPSASMTAMMLVAFCIIEEGGSEPTRHQFVDMAQWALASEHNFPRRVMAKQLSLIARALETLSRAGSRVDRTALPVLLEGAVRKEVCDEVLEWACNPQLTPDLGRINLDSLTTAAYASGMLFCVLNDLLVTPIIDLIEYHDRPPAVWWKSCAGRWESYAGR